MSDFISEVDILDEAKEDFLVYAEEVLTDRAVPSIEDGLLSVHRKLIWTMEHVLKMNSKGNRKKSASIVGSTLASSYFHGDASCYGALCKMSLDYLMRYPLVIGQGSLGTQEDNDMRAAARYTEAKPSEFADLMMEDFNKNIVPLKETYNGEYMEPVVLPSAFPNAIVNGKESIAVGLSHNSAPHNLTEVCNAIIAYLHNENLTLDEFMTYVPGPDFPLGGTIININDVKEAYRTGKSKVSLKVRGDYEIKGNVITFTSIPYRTYRNKIKEQINENIDEFDKVFDDFNDESNLGKNKLVFVVKKDVDPVSAVNKLFRLTDLQTSISLNMNYIVNGTPKLCSMLDMIKYYVEHQHNMMINAAVFDKEKAEARAHIIRGILAAVDKIDEVIALIKASNSRTEATEKLINFLAIDKIQATAILDMKLGKLTRIDKEELVNELKEKEALIETCKKIINDKAYRTELLIEKIEKLKKKYGDARRTKLMQIDIPKDDKEIAEVISEDVVVIVSQKGNVKRIPVKNFKVQKRNGKGVKNEDEAILDSISTNTVDTLMIFTNKGKMYRLLVNDVPVGTNSSHGVTLSSLIKMENDEKVVAVTSLYRKTNAEFVIFITKNGLVKKTAIEEYTKTKRSTGIAAINIKEGDEIINVTFLKDEDLMLVTKKGLTIRFETTNITPIGRVTAGVKSIKLNDGDQVLIGLPIHNEKDSLAVFTEKGFGKKIAISEFPVQGRGGKGLAIYKSTAATGDIVGITMLSDEDNILLIGKPNSICIGAKDVPQSGRASTGNIMLKDSKIISVVKL